MPYCDLEFTKEIGHGAFGKVFKGKWNGKEVALKTLPIPDGADASDIVKHNEEIAALRLVHIHVLWPQFHIMNI